MKDQQQQSAAEDALQQALSAAVSKAIDDELPNAIVVGHLECMKMALLMAVSKTSDMFKNRG